MQMVGAREETNFKEQSLDMGDRWEPQLGYFYHMPLPTPPFDIHLTLQSSFTEIFHDILMGSGCPKCVYMQISKGTREKNKSERGGDNLCSQNVQAIVRSLDYVTCIHSLFECPAVDQTPIKTHVQSRNNNWCHYYYIIIINSLPPHLFSILIFLRGGHRPLKHIAPLQAIAPSAGI